MSRLAWSVLAAGALLAPRVARAADECQCDGAWSLPRAMEPPSGAGASARGALDGAAFDATAIDGAAFDAAAPAGDAAPGVDGGGPPPGPRKVPTNGRLFISWPGVADADLTLAIQGGGSIDFAVEPASDALAYQRWIVPSPLPANQTIVLAAAGGPTLTFETDDRTDDAPPVLRGLESQGARLPGDCPPHLAGEIRTIGLTAPDTESDVVLEVDLQRLGQDGEHMTLVLPPWSPYLGLITSDDPVERTCLANVAAAMPAWDYLAKVHVVDVARNATDRATNDDGSAGPLLETEFRFADNPARGCGCRVGGAREPARGEGVLAGLAGLVLLVGAVRRRQT